MARPAKFGRDEILDAALSAITSHGPGATVAQVAIQIGAPIGSIYHRFASREELFVSLWLRSIQRLHVGYLEAASLSDPEEALMATIAHIVDYCRQHPDEALAMTMYRHARLLKDGPPRLMPEIRPLNDAVFAALGDLCQRRYGTADEAHFELLIVAVQQMPYGLLRPHIGAEELPEWLTKVCQAGARAIVALGDQS